MSARLVGLPGSVKARPFGQVAGAAVVDVAAGAVLAVVLTAPVWLPPDPEEQAAFSTRPTKKRTRVTPS
jgi:hypothetical protein